MLKSRLHLREPGAEYIFNLQGMGIAENDEECAIQIYHWIVLRQNTRQLQVYASRLHPGRFPLLANFTS